MKTFVLRVSSMSAVFTVLCGVCPSYALSVTVLSCGVIL